MRRSLRRTFFRPEGLTVLENPWYYVKILPNRVIFQGYNRVLDSFFKVADIYLKHRRYGLPRGGMRGMLPQDIFKIEHSETLFPAFPRQSPRQGWSSLKCFLKSNIFSESGQLDRGNWTEDPRRGSGSKSLRYLSGDDDDDNNDNNNNNININNNNNNKTVKKTPQILASKYRT